MKGACWAANGGDMEFLTLQETFRKCYDGDPHWNRIFE